jgi:hypothetical protein
VAVSADKSAETSKNANELPRTLRESSPPHPQTAERKRANVKPLIDEMRAIECGPCSEQNPSLAKRIGEWALKLEQAAASQPVGDSTPAPSPPNRYATSEEVKESAARMIVKHRKALEKLAKSDVAPEGKTVDASDER